MDPFFAVFWCCDIGFLLLYEKNQLVWHWVATQGRPFSRHLRGTLNYNMLRNVLQQHFLLFLLCYLWNQTIWEAKKVLFVGTMSYIAISKDIIPSNRLSQTERNLTSYMSILVNSATDVENHFKLLKYGVSL